MKFNILILLFVFGSITTVFSQLKISDEGSIVSMKIMEVNSKYDIVNQNSQIRLIPASLTKLITTATALELLGPDYRYKTNFVCGGDIINGQLLGDIHVQAGGDPTLGSKYFEETAPELVFKNILSWLKEKGIHSIKGGIFVDSSKIGYSSPRLWEDIGNYYGVYPQSFNWKDNTVKVTLASKKVGTVCRVVSIDTDISPYILDCKVKAASHHKDSAYVYGLPEINKWWIEGSIPSNRAAFNVKAAMPDPKMIFSRELSNFLEKNHVSVKQEVVLDDEVKDTKIVYTHYSPKMSEIIKVVNHKSHNLFADMLLLTLAKEYYQCYSWDRGTQVIKDFWKDKIDFENNFRLRDGSGLTPKNLISTEGMVELLTWMNENSSYFNVYKNSLAVGGKSGTLKSVFKNTQLKNKVFGKSGSMEGVLGYCGYYLNTKGNYCAFSAIANNFMIKTKQVRMEMDEALTNYILSY